MYYKTIENGRTLSEWTERYAQVEITTEESELLLGDCRAGIPIGTPTVKELIAILSRLPEDYRVYCCGGENYLYIWENNKSITIDCEDYLS